MDVQIVVVAALAFLALYGVAVFNRLVAGRNGVRAAWKQIDVQLKRRHDLIPNLVASAKDYMSYEQDTLRQVVEARTKAVEAKNVSESVAAEGILGQALGRLLAVFEAYPDLKAQANVGQLMEELTATENRIAFARQHYNEAALEQNNRVEQFPSNLVAGIFRFGPETYFEVPEDSAEREAPKVSLR